MQLPGGWELVLILVVLVALFGSKRLPGAAKSVGQSMRIFKKEIRDGHDGDDDRAKRADLADKPADTDR